MIAHLRPAVTTILAIIFCSGIIVCTQAVYSQEEQPPQPALVQPISTTSWESQFVDSPHADHDDDSTEHVAAHGQDYALFLPVLQSAGAAAPTATPTTTPALSPTPSPTSSPTTTPLPSATASPTPRPYLELVQQIGGSANVALVRGDLAYVGVGPRLVIVDISSPENPIVVGQSEMLADAIRGIALVDEYAFIANGATFLVINVSNPASPELVYVHGTISVTEDVTVADGIAYVANAQRGISIFDVTNPRSPRYLTTYQTESLALAIDIVGDLAFVVDYYAGIKILDVSQPAAPRLVSSYRDLYAASGIDVVDGVAYVSDAMRGLYILDASDPYSLTELSVFPAQWTFGEYQYYQDILLVEDALYIASQRFGLVAFDVADTAAPVIAGILPAQDALRVTAQASSVYVSDREVGLLIVEAGSPSNLQVSGVYRAGKLEDVTVQEGAAYAGKYGALQVYGLEEPSAPLLLATMPMSGSVLVDAANDMLYVAAFVDGVYMQVSVLDGETPASLEVLSTIDLDGRPMDIAVSGSYAVISYRSSSWWTGVGGFHVVDVSDKHQPRVMSSVQDLPNVFNVQVAGNYVYAAAYDKGARIYSIEDPQNPTLVGSYQTPYYAVDIEVESLRAYVSDSLAGVLVLDISSPPTPTLMGTYNSLDAYKQGLAVQDGVAYFMSLAGLTAVDLTNPAEPRLLGAVELPGNSGGSGSIKDVVIQRQTAYVDAMFEGLQVVQITAP